MNPDEAALLLCPVCNKPVPLETAKTDALGRAIHGECYLRLVREKQSAEFSERPC
jgi:hypothetical protein